MVGFVTCETYVILNDIFNVQTYIYTCVRWFNRDPQNLRGWFPQRTIPASVRQTHLPEEPHGQLVHRLHCNWKMCIPNVSLAHKMYDFELISPLSHQIMSRGNITI